MEPTYAALAALTKRRAKRPQVTVGPNTRWVASAGGTLCPVASTKSLSRFERKVQILAPVGKSSKQQSSVKSNSNHNSPYSTTLGEDGKAALCWHRCKLA